MKRQDEIETSRQCRSTIEVWLIARELGLEDQDKFTLIPSNPPHVQRFPQQHARRAESVLWVFKKPLPPRVRKVRCPEKPVDVQPDGEPRPRRRGRPPRTTA